MKITVAQRVLKANDTVAQENRKVFKEAGLLSLNLISSPGSGKTTLLEKTLPALKPEKSIVIVGDLETTRDAERVEKEALDVVQINTGMSCHLYANQVTESLKGLPLKEADYLFIENVGNMVCPGEFDLGENLKVILLSIPEGDDKVAKYPTIFRAADLVLLTKIDLAGMLSFNKERVYKDIAKLNVNVSIVEISATTGQGFDQWLTWLKENRQKSLGLQAKFIKES